LTVLHGLLFIVLGFLVAHPFLELFTTDEQIIQWGVQYAVIVFTFSMGYLLQISMEKIFQSVGEMMITMVILASGSIINIILDPIFIFGWFGFPALGVAGAAIATVIGQTAAFFFYLIAYKKKKLPVEIHLRYLQWNGQLVWKLYYIGIPAAITMALPSILAGALNKLLSAYGDVYVAVMGIYFKLQTFLYMPSNGIIQGIRPIISCNYGAGRYDRMWETIGRSVAAVAVIMLLGTVLCWLLPEQLMLLFDDDAALVALGAHVLPLIVWAFCFLWCHFIWCDGSLGQRFGFVGIILAAANGADRTAGLAVKQLA
ncbi:MAG: MATE family efflux transporter, partial [Peptococcaceae bacterium]